MRTITKNWNLARILRLFLGLAAVAQGIFTGEIMMMVAGGLIAAMGLFNIGCCGAGGCEIKPAVKKESVSKEIVYEEVVK